LSARAAPTRFLLLFVAAITLFRLWAAWATPLTEDEAYYRLWAQSLQFGYFDHPPMIAWWIRLGETIAGDTSLGVRLIPVLSCGATTLLVFDLAQRLGLAAKAAERAAVWTNATLLIGAGGMIATPDAAAVPFWALTLWCLVRADEENKAWWLAAGLFAGLAAISKYSALFLAPGVGLWLLWKPGGLSALRKPWPWLAALIAAAVFSVNLVWNAEHHWVSFIKQFGRIAPGRFAPQFVLELVIGQFLLLNPIIAGFALRGVAEAGRQRGEALRLLAATIAPFAAYLVVHALHDRVQAHWPVPLYPSLAILAASAADEVRPGGWAAKLRAIAAPLGLGASALALLHAGLPSTDFRHVRDPAGAVRGWPKFARELEALRLAHGAAWIGAVAYGTTAELADQPAIHAPSVQIVERARYPANDASWRADMSRPGVVVDLQRRDAADPLQRCFASVTPLGPLVRGKGLDHNQRYVAFLVAGPRRDVLKDGC
jgi:4-amino-4-deoxy-L-arabinose transferase-like glycosyltransferase